MFLLRWWRLAGAIALLATLVAPALPGAAGGRALAHAQLVASSPGAGSVLDTGPDELRLVFSEPLEAQATSLDVVAQDGTALLDHAGEVDPDDPFALVVEGPDLPDGVYSLTWRTLSTADGHTAEGFFTFGIGDVSASLPSVGGGMIHEETDPLAVGGRWLTYIGLLAALGVAVFHRVVIRDGPMPRRLTRLLAVGLATSATATLVVAVASALEVGSIGDYLLASRNGALQLGRAVAAAAGAAALLVVPVRFATAVAGLAGLAGIVLLIVAGHAAALPGIVPLVSGVVHVAGASIWIGGVLCLLALVARPQLLVDGRPPGASRVVPRFSALALVSIGLVSLTGVYSAWVQTGVLISTDTDYGRTLLIKSGVAVVALAMGGLNYIDGGRMLGWLDGLRSRLSIEVASITAVLLVTALLATTPPTEEAPGVAIEPIPDAFGSVTPGMTMDIVPGRPGVNRVVVSTTDAMAAGSARLELALDRVDTGSTARVPLTLEGMAAGTDHSGMDHGAMIEADSDGTVDWVADAIILPADSRWDTSVRILSSADAEVSRQRFAFTMAEDGVDEGRVGTLLTPALGVGVLLLVSGALGLGLGFGGMALPRCEAWASRVALVGGGTTAVVLGLLIGVSRLVG